MSGYKLIVIGKGGREGGKKNGKPALWSGPAARARREVK